MAHRWSIKLKPLEPTWTKHRCSKCGILRHGRPYLLTMGKKAVKTFHYSYKRGNRFVDGTGLLGDGVPQCDERLVSPK
jgi:hypothetical protein